MNDLNETPMTDEEIAAEKAQIKAEIYDSRKENFDYYVRKFRLMKCEKRMHDKNHYLKRSDFMKGVIVCEFCDEQMTDSTGYALHEV